MKRLARKMDSEPKKKVKKKEIYIYAKVGGRASSDELKSLVEKALEASFIDYSFVYICQNDPRDVWPHAMAELREAA